MATTSDHLQLYFGCTAQTPIIGGAGLVTLRAPTDNFRFPSSKVVPVRTAAAESPLFAGSMFVIQRRKPSVSARLNSSSRGHPSMLSALAVFSTWFSAVGEFLGNYVGILKWIIWMMILMYPCFFIILWSELKETFRHLWMILSQMTLSYAYLLS